MMLNMDPPQHTKLRLLVNKGFTPRMVGVMEDRIRQATVEVLDNVARGGSCDFVTDIAAELPLMVIAEVMGVPVEDRAKVFDWSNRLIGFDDPEYNTSMESAQEASMELYAYANNLAAERRANPRDDLVSVLLEAEVDGEKLTELEFDLFFLLLAVAGNETTRNAISHGMLGVLRAPRPVEAPGRRPVADADHGGGDPALGLAGDALPAHGDEGHRDRRRSRSPRATRS